MRPFFLPTLNCFVGDEPRVSAATQIVPLSMTPARDVALVLIRHAKREPIQLNPTGLREMKNIFVAIVEKSRRIDRLEMAKRTNGCSGFPACRAEAMRRRVGNARVAHRATATMIVDRDGFNPVNRVLQNE